MIKIQNIILQTIKFNFVNIVSALIQIPTQIIIGIFLLPEEYGVISLVGLWSLYSGLINPGMLQAGQREIPYLIGRKDNENSIKIQNIAISSDFIYSLIPFLVIIVSSLFYSNKIIKIGLIITSFYFIINRISTYWSSINFVRQNFTIVAIGKFIGVVLTPVLIICLISSYGVYAVLIAPLIGSVITGIYYLVKGPIKFRFNIDKKEILRLIKVGYVLSLSGVIFYGYKMADSTVIASFLPLSDLGLFSFAMGLILFGINFISDFGRVLEPIIWEHSGKINVAENSFYNTKSMIIYLAVFTSIVIPFAQICYGIIIQYFVPKYSESLPIFIILSSMLYLATMPIIPNIILNSVVVNKQSLVALIYSFGLIINIVLDIIFVKAGYGINTISLITIGSQCLITLTLYVFAINYILIDKNIKKFVLLSIFPFVISIIFSISHYYFSNLYPISAYGISISLLFQVIIWSIIMMIIYKEFFSLKDVFVFINEISKKTKL